MIFTDPPYNMPIGGHVSGLGRIHHAEFAMASGETSNALFAAFLKTVLGQLAAHSTDGALHFVCIDWRHVYELLSATRDIYDEMKNLRVWAKINAGMGSLYRSQHELVFVFKSGTRSAYQQCGARLGCSAAGSVRVYRTTRAYGSRIDMRKY